MFSCQTDLFNGSLIVTTVRCTLWFRLNASGPKAMHLTLFDCDILRLKYCFELSTYLVFLCTGAMASTMQEVNVQVAVRVCRLCV